MHCCRVLAFVAIAVACGDAADRTPESRTLVTYNAGSLARPLRAALDSFAARESVQVMQESAGSLETARKLTELGKIPDVLALADEDVFTHFLLPDHVSWYVRFARNRMVLAHTRLSRHADGFSDSTWWRVLLRSGVETGRADPARDPNGYRTLLVMQLAERHYSEPGLAARLLAAIPPRNVRASETDLVGLLQAGEMDYIWSYESMARAQGLEYVRLPAAIDLSSPADSATYAQAAVTLRGRGTDSVTLRGRPIAYALSIPRQAPHPAMAELFVRYLLSADGRRVLRSQGLDVLDATGVVGTGLPAGLAP